MLTLNCSNERQTNILTYKSAFSIIYKEAMALYRNWYWIWIYHYVIIFCMELNNYNHVTFCNTVYNLKIVLSSIQSWFRIVFLTIFLHFCWFLLLCRLYLENIFVMSPKLLTSCCKSVAFRSTYKCFIMTFATLWKQNIERR